MRRLLLQASAEFPVNLVVQYQVLLREENPALLVLLNV